MGTIRANNKPWDYIYRLKKEKLSIKYGMHNYTKVIYGHIIKRVLKAVYYYTKNDVDFDPQKTYKSTMVPKSMLEQK